MAVDADRWRERGAHVRAVESARGPSNEIARAQAVRAVCAGLAPALTGLSEADWNAAVGCAVEGYLAEHLARGGTVAPNCN